MKQECLSAIGDQSPLIRATVGLVVSMIANKGELINWPEVLSTLCQFIESQDQFLCEVCSTAFCTFHSIHLFIHPFVLLSVYPFIRVHVLGLGRKLQNNIWSFVSKNNQIFEGSNMFLIIFIDVTLTLIGYKTPSKCAHVQTLKWVWQWSFEGRMHSPNMYMYIYLSIHLSVFIRPFVYSFHIHIYSFIYPFTYIYPSTHPITFHPQSSIHQPVLHPNDIHPSSTQSSSIYPSIHPSIYVHTGCIQCLVEDMWRL